MYQLGAPRAPSAGRVRQGVYGGGAAPAMMNLPGAGYAAGYRGAAGQQVYGQQPMYGQGMVQSPYGQQQMYGQPQMMQAPQPAQPAMAPMGMQGMYGQQVQPAATPQQKAMSEKIDSFESYALYMNTVKPFFDAVAGPHGRLTQTAVQRFVNEASQGLLGGSLGAVGSVSPQEFTRFDFGGDGTLTFVEAAKLLKRQMLEFQQKIGCAAVVPVPFKTPQQAGYQVGKVLASGGQGSVSLATGSMGQVALKTYEKTNPNACSIEDLRSEMEVMKTMERCTHIMHAYEIFQDAQNFYCVDELLSGGDLTSLRKNARSSGIRLDETYFRNIFSQSMGALEYMHRHAMMHCDIKEPNIMFKSKDYRNPVIALIDFGMSKWSSSDGMAGGTPGYRPPETNETNVWFPRGDIFSMGVTFFQLLADKVPDEDTMSPGIFTEGAQTMEQVNYFVKTRQAPFHLIRGKYPGVMSWLPKMLDKNMRNRPKAPELFNNAWFHEQGAAADAIMPETGWVMPNAAAMADDDDEDDVTIVQSFGEGYPQPPPPPQPAPVIRAAPPQQASAPRIVQAHEYSNPGVSPRMVQAPQVLQGFHSQGGVPRGQGFQSARVIRGGVM